MTTLSASQIAGYAKNAGVTGQNIAIATAIALAESGGRTDAVGHNTNGSTDSGVWQINSIHKDLLSGHDPFDPAQNAAMMFTISSGGTNWKPWSTYTSGKYMSFLSQANGATPDTSVGSVQQAGISEDFSAIQRFAEFISNPRTWARLGMIVGGGVMVYVAVHKSLDIKLPVVSKIASKVAV